MQVRSVVARLARPETRGKLVTVREYAERYLKRRQRQLAPRSLVNARVAFEALFNYLGSRADMPLASLRRAEARSFVDAQLERVRRPTVVKYIGYISPMFMAALEDEMIDRNPFFRLRVPESRVFAPVKKGAFTPEEVRAMLGALSPEFRSMVLCCLFLGGQRLGDVATLRWEQVDREAGLVTLTTGKTRREMAIPIIPALAEHLSSLPRESEYLHPWAAKTYLKAGPSPISSRFRAELEEGGIVPPFVASGREHAPKTFHSLRATAATLLHEVGVDDALAREVVGHDTAAAHQHYIRPDTEARRSALSRLSGALGFRQAN